MIAIKTVIQSILQGQRQEYEAVLDATQNRVFRRRDLIEVLSPFRIEPEHDDKTGLSIPLVTQDEIIKFLLAESYLRMISFNLYRLESLFVWRDVSPYLLLPTLRPNGYYSHHSALFFNGLIDIEPKEVYFNCEQVTHGKQGELEQDRIDHAFKNRQRQTTAKTLSDNKVYWYLNGKQTGNYGVEFIVVSPGASVSVTNLERTLIDVVVRPVYAGGVENVLSAFRAAKSRLSIEKLIQTLRLLNYTYPYHQSIGFYLELAGFDQEVTAAMRGFDEMRFDFYLDYHMEDPCYNAAWKVYYPCSLIQGKGSK